MDLKRILMVLYEVFMGIHLNIINVIALIGSCRVRVYVNGCEI